MKINLLELRELLADWLQSSNWHTTHTQNVEAFNHAIHKVFTKYGVGVVPVETFAQAILDDINERNHVDPLSEDLLDNRVHELIITFESISRYLSDTE